MAKKLTSILSCILGCGISISLAAQQQVVANSGGEGTAAGINLQWTLGESVIQSSSVVAGVQITQGFQQPAYEVQTLIEAPELTFALNVFPVPASDFITIEVGKGALPGLTAVLFDMNGSMIIQQNLSFEKNQIDMQSFGAGHYLLNISDSAGNILKSIKIVKQ